MSLALLQFLMNNQVQFVYLWCCALPEFVLQINNLFSLVLFSALIYDRKGKKLISKTIKYKLGKSSKKEFPFFNFLLEENYRFCQKSGNDRYSRRQMGHAFCVIMTQCLQKAMCCSLLRDKIIVLLLNRQSLPLYIKVPFFELNLTNQNWLLCCSYNLHNNLAKEDLWVPREGSQFYSKDYEKILSMWDFNTEDTETKISSLCEIYHLTDIIQQTTCFENPSNSSCIDQCKLFLKIFSFWNQIFWFP